MTLDDESLNGNALINGSNNDVAMKNSFRLVILGAPRVGKSCIINWFLGKQIKDSYIPTIEDFHRKIYKIRGEIYRLDILDTSGNDPFPAMKKLNIMTGDLFVLVYSIDDIDSYLQVKQLCELIMELKKSKQDHHRNSHNIPILILGNKLDYLLDNKITSRCVDTNETQQFTSSLKSCIYSEISCKNLIGLDSSFEKLFTQANLPVEMIPSKHRRVSLNLDLTKPQFTRQNIIQAANQQLANSQIDKEKETGCTTTYCTKGSNKVYNDSSSYVNGNGVSSTSNSLMNVDREGSFKMTAKKSFRKMTFRRQLTEACGAVWLNARRPSIRAELKLLQVKSNGNFSYHQGGLNRKNKTAYTDSRFQLVINNFKKLFCCNLNRNGSSNSKSKFLSKKIF